MFTAVLIAVILSEYQDRKVSPPPAVQSQPARLKPGTLKPGEQVFVLKFTVYQGDSAGTRQDRTVRILNQPTLIVRENHPVRFAVVTGEVQVTTPEGPTVLQSGISLQARFQRKDKDSVTVSICCEDQAAMEDGLGVVHVSSRAAKLLGVVKLGVLQSLQLCDNDPKNATWVELTIRPYEPDRAKVPAAQ